MKILKFKTNIENSLMIEKLTPFLNSEELVSKWKVDTESEENILSVSGEEVTPEIVKKAVNKAGFQAEVIRVHAIGGHDL